MSLSARNFDMLIGKLKPFSFKNYSSLDILALEFSTPNELRNLPFTAYTVGLHTLYVTKRILCIVHKKFKQIMNKNQIRHKCGYCGWLFCFTTNFLEHECFKHYVEGEDRIYVDENNVVTLCNTKTAEGPVCKDVIDELLIGAVKARKGLYDYTLPASERSSLRKNALWAEVSNTIGGALSPDKAKARWKYLRDNYAKARKKVKSYIPSGSAAKANVLKKSNFRFYDVMTFLNDFLETRKTVSSLSDNITEIYETSEQQENDSVASSSESTDISFWTSTTVNAYPPMLTPTHVSPRTPTTVLPPLISVSSPNNVPSRTPQTLSTSQILSTNSKRPLQTASYNVDTSRQTPLEKKQKSDALQAALIEALKEPPTQAADPLDGFFARLGEGMRRLPYRERARLEITFLTLLAEKEDLYAYTDRNAGPSTR